MSYIKEKQNYLEKNKLIFKIMMLYIEDYEFLYQCIGIDTCSVILDIEDLIVDLVDFQGDGIHYSPLALA